MAHMMSVTTGTTRPGESWTLEQRLGGIWVARGELDANCARVGRSSAAFLSHGDAVSVAGSEPCEWVLFTIGEGADTGDALLSAEISLPRTGDGKDVLLRLDEVRFPPGAVAYRHIHPGDGIRFLTQGELQIFGDHQQETAEPGHAWFEPANSPVRAEASATEPATGFVRFMVLPSAYLGRPTITILDPDDAKLPRLQVTHRHVDRIVQF